MADIRAFRGLRYNLSKVGDLSSVVSPPYDVISPEAQRAYYDRSKYNVIRLELGIDQEGDTEANNKYTRAAALFDEWQRIDVLMREPQPSMYVYEQEFAYKGRQLVRRGIIACLKLEPWDAGVVLPHEEVLAKPLADRISLMRACQSNFSPIFGLYEDQSGDISNLVKSWTTKDPAEKVRTADDGEDHRVWVVSDAQALSELQRLISNERVFIADGHHRYTTALKYRDEMREKNPGFTGDEAFNYVMILLVALEDPGLVVLPTHRMVRSQELDLTALEKGLQKYFHIEHRKVGSEEQVEEFLTELSKINGGNKAFGAYGLRPDTYSILVLDRNTDLKKILPHEKSSPWKDLDISVLHSLVVERILGIGNMSAAEGNSISFTRSERQAVQGVRKGDFSLSFFVNAPSVGQVRAVALAGDKMPQKSTYFHPKPLTGLVINRLDGKLSRVYKGN